jgi:hypothetical protein
MKERTRIHPMKRATYFTFMSPPVYPFKFLDLHKQQHIRQIAP